MGNLALVPVLDRLDLVAEPVAAFVKQWPAAGQIQVAEIDPSFSDTAAFCERYEVPLDAAANCVIVAGTRAGVTTYAGCMILGTTRADVNGVARRQLGARKASFAPMEEATAHSGMEYGGITPIGLPSDWPLLVDSRVAAAPLVLIGSGVRHSKLVLPGALLTELPTSVVVDGLAKPA